MNEQKPSINSITLTKEAYDKIKAENMRCRMLMDGIWKTMQFESDESYEMDYNHKKVLLILETLYPDTYSTKLSQLKRLRTIAREKALGREI